MRDAKRDLAACEAATPPPWTTKPSGETINGFSCDVVIAATAGGQKIYAQPEGGTFPYADQQFIALAREALPYWINRAVEAEAREGQLWEALEYYANSRILLSEPGTICADIEVARQALSRPRPAILNRLERMEKEEGARQ